MRSLFRADGEGTLASASRPINRHLTVFLQDAFGSMRCIVVLFSFPLYCTFPLIFIPFLLDIKSVQHRTARDLGAVSPTTSNRNQ